MSRTYRDTKRRAKRAHGYDESCGLCEHTRKVTTHTYAIAAIFYAHEHKLVNELVTLANEQGYEVSERELQGFLGAYSEDDDYRAHRNRSIHGVVLGGFDTSRALYSEPRGVPQRMLVNVHGFNERHGDEIPVRDPSDFFFNENARVSHKRNLFIVVELTKRVSRERTRCPKHESAYDFNIEPCDCRSCARDQQVTLRRDFSKLKKRFNSGGFKEIEDS